MLCCGEGKGSLEAGGMEAALVRVVRGEAGQPQPRAWSPPLGNIPPLVRMVHVWWSLSVCHINALKSFFSR